jgi:hypothetical protein
MDLKAGRTLLSDELNSSSRRVAIRIAKSMIADVGQMPSCLEQMPFSFQYRRAITDSELAGLPAAWCAIPPVHAAGHFIILERDT